MGYTSHEVKNVHLIDKSQFGRFIAELRRDKQLTQRELAENLNKIMRKGSLKAFAHYLCKHFTECIYSTALKAGYLHL